ncbi:MAG: hypothetical protein ACLFQ5_13420 [Oceanicaulis sp.]
MARRRILTASAFLPALALAACEADREELDQDASDMAASNEDAPAYDDGAMDPGGDQDETAPNQTGAATAARTARGGDAVSVGGDIQRGPAVEAVSRRFGLSDADTVILPTLYRATADITSTNLTVDRSQGDLGFITVSGSADLDEVMQRPRDGLAFELTDDRVNELLGQPVIVTFVARMGEDWEGDGQRPALRAAWIEPDGDSSGWRTMNLTEDWQKAVFAYDQPTDTSGTHLLTIVPPSDQPVDIAAVAIRAQGAADVPDAQAGGDRDRAQPMQQEASGNGGGNEDG